MRRALLAVAVLLAVNVSRPVNAQPRAGETIEVSIVNVDVLVTDKTGKRVYGLTADDFELREEGKLQPISNFAEYAPAIMGQGASIEDDVAAAEAAAANRPPRTVVIFVESTSRLTPHQSKQMFDAIRSLVQDTVSKGDRVTIVSWRGSVLVRQPFTDDVDVLGGVLDTLEVELTRGQRDDARDVRRQQAENDADAVGMGAEGMPQVDALLAAKMQNIQIRQKAAVLEALMHSISGMDGRKIIIMAMRRFGLYAGAEYYGGEVPLEYRSEFDTVKLRNSLIRTANAHGIALYPVYAPGLKWDMDDASVAGTTGGNPDADLMRGALENKVLFNETTALQDLATGTGGLMAWGAANIAEMLPRVADDLEAYYSLGYRSRATGKDVTRKITVRTKNPDYEVRSRKHFVEKSDDSLMKDRVTANLYQPIGGSTIPFDVGVGIPVKDGRKRWTMPLKLRIPIASLMTLQEGATHAGEFSVYIVTGAVVGVMSEVQQRTQPFRIPHADLAKAKSSHYTYDFTLRLDEEVDRVSVGLLDQVAKEFGLKRIAIPARSK
jgi:VWFA-related protein